MEAGEKLGFLPGTLQEKVDPYLRPLYDALYEMLDSEKVEKLLERNVIEVAPIAFMRGRTLNDAFIIFDEAQNSTPEQMKMVLTRQGFNSKMVVTGDITQIDLPAGRGSGLLNAIEVLARDRGDPVCALRRTGRGEAHAGAEDRARLRALSGSDGREPATDAALERNRRQARRRPCRGRGEYRTRESRCSRIRPGPLRSSEVGSVMPESDHSLVLFRPHIQVDRPGLRAFARRLRAEVTEGRAFTCLLTGDAELRQLNHQFLGKDYATDVLSFPSPSPDGSLGEMAISVERAREQAAGFGHSIEDEIEVLMLHGVLHLMGMDHESDGGRMRRVEMKWRKALGLPGGLIERSKAKGGKPERSKSGSARGAA